MRWLVSELSLLSWFTGGALLGLIEVIQLPTDPIRSTSLQLLPLLFLAGGLWFVVSEYKKARATHDDLSYRLRRVMDVGWIAVFGVNVGLASLNNFATVLFHYQLPYYYQGVSTSQKVIALAGIFVIGASSIIAELHLRETTTAREPVDLSDRPVTGLGFIITLLGLVLGLAQYWYIVVLSGFVLVIAGVLLFLVGKIIETPFMKPAAT